MHGGEQANEDAVEGERGHKVYWVARQRRWFGTLGISDVMLLTVCQLLLGTYGVAVGNFVITWLTRLVFWLYGCNHWLPEDSFDLHKEQLVPNRGHLLLYKHRLDRRVRGRAKGQHLWGKFLSTRREPVPRLLWGLSVYRASEG